MLCEDVKGNDEGDNGDTSKREDEKRRG